MRILIKEIEKGPFEDELYDNVITGISESGNEINIETTENVSAFKAYINQKVDLLLFINHLTPKPLEYFRKKGYPIYTGKCLGDYIIGPEWKYKFDLSNSELIGIETEEGMLLTSKKACERESIKEGDIFKFTTWSYDIVAWSPPE